MKRMTHASRFETLHHNRDNILSLMALNQMLTQAHKTLPPRPASQPEDASDELALQMIANVKRQFKCSTPAHWIRILLPGSKKRPGPMSDEKKKPARPSRSTESQRDGRDLQETNFLPPLKMVLAFLDQDEKEKNARSTKGSDERNVEKLIEKLSEKEDE